MVLFGMNTKYWTMIVTRCIGGASTWVDRARSEISDKDSRSSVYTLIMVGLQAQSPASAKPQKQVSYRMGEIVGQPMGGFLAHPKRHCQRRPNWRIKRPRCAVIVSTCRYSDKINLFIQ
jgi:hypothetical protein